MQRICVVYYEMANGLNLEMHRQMEIAKRLNAILTQVIPFLAQEVRISAFNNSISSQHQSQVASAIDRAKQVTMQELNTVLAAQMEDSKLSKFANGGNMGLSNDQLEMYKVGFHTRFLTYFLIATSSTTNVFGQPSHITSRWWLI